MGVTELFYCSAVSTPLHHWVTGDFFPSSHFLKESSLGLIASYR